MSAAPPVSVVLPVRDGAPFLEEALRSLVAQTFADFELIVQDDGSTDDTPEVLRAFARADPRVRPASGPARGVAHAANAAARRARGDLLVRMDADDVCRPERLERLVALAAEHPDVDWFGSRTRYVPREAVGPGLARYETWLNGLLTHEEIHRERFVEYPLAHPSTAVRRGLWLRLGGYRQGPFPEDYDLFLRAAAAGARFAKHPEVLLDWREGPHRSTKRDARYGLDRFRELKADHLGPLLQAAGRPVALLGSGTAGRHWERALARRGLPPACFLDLRPDRVGGRVRGREVRPVATLASRRDLFVLVTHGGAEGRARARAAVRAQGLREERDFLCLQ